MTDAPVCPPLDALLLQRVGPVLAAGLVRGGQLDDLIVVPGGAEPTTGDVVVGRVSRVQPALAAVFVDIGGPEHALLRARDLGRGDAAPSGHAVHEGKKLAVRIVHPGYDDKGPRVIGRVGADLRAAAADRAVGSILYRSEPLDEVQRAIGPAEPGEIVVADTVARLQVSQAWRRAGRGEPRITIDDDSRPLARHDAHGDIALALERALPLAGGGRLTFDQSRALLAVDVDSGAEARDLTAVNVAAAREIARQLRIRNSAGVIVIDFIDAPAFGRNADARVAVDTVLRRAVTADRAGCRLAGYGPLGLYELTRRRAGPTLAAVWPTADDTPDQAAIGVS